MSVVISSCFRLHTLTYADDSTSPLQALAGALHYHDHFCQSLTHATPTLFSPFSDPKLNANPCDRLRMRTNPVIGPSSPSFSMLKLARASSPAGSQYTK